MSAARGIVKAVESGDTLMVMGFATNGPPLEKRLTLSTIMAPRMGRPGTEPEPYAWLSREFLRKMCIGKEVSFRLDGSTNASGPGGREFANVFLGDERISVVLVRAGLARVKNLSEDRRDDDYQALEQAQEEATAEGCGMWAKTEDAEALHKFDPEVDAQDLLRAQKGKPLTGVVEYVRDGHSTRISLPDSKLIWLQFAGVQCPFNSAAKEGKPEKRPPFADQSRFFTECRVLHRDVQVTLEGLDKYGNFFGTVTYGEDNNNIALELLQFGLGQISSWTIGQTKHAAALRAAEKSARDQRLRIWQNWTPAADPNIAPAKSEREYQARVLEIASGDCIVVLHLSQRKEVRLYLSNIRAPRQGKKEEPWPSCAWEAREYLRNKLIGKRISVYVDHIKPAQDNFPERICATITTEKGMNVSEALVNQGFATVVKLRHDSAERSLYYDSLLASEDNAKNGKRGLHSNNVPPPLRLFDCSGPNSKKAKQYLSSLQRSGRQRAVVEYVFGGARVKVTIPKENLQLILAFAGVRCPMYKKDDPTKCEQYGFEAYSCSRSLLLHRDVEVSVDNVDQKGSFFGSLWVGEKNHAVTLVEHGLARCVNADRAKDGHLLERAEREAKQGRKGQWANWDPSQDEVPATEDDNAAASAQQTVAPPTKTYQAAVTEIVDANLFYVHLDTGAGLDGIDARIEAATLVQTATEGWTPRRNEFCVGQFSADNNWYRCKIVELSTDKSGARVLYIDYGNSEVIPMDRLKPLNPASLQQLPAQATEVRLAYLKCPEGTADYGDEAALLLRELIWGKKIALTVEQQDGPVVHATLVVDGTNINSEMLTLGYARVDKSRRVVPAWLQPRMAAMNEAQESARKGRRGMWEYGDIADDEGAPEFGWKK